MTNESLLRSYPARFSLAVVSAAVAAAVWVTGLSSVLRHLGPANQPLAAGRLVIAALLAGAISGGAASLLARRAALIWAAAAGIAAFTVLAATGAVHAAAGASLVVSALLASVLAGTLAPRLPSWVDEAVRPRKALAIVWLTATLFGVVQVARLSTYVIDQKSEWHLGTEHPFWKGHMCLPAYIYAAELDERGDANVYAEEHYPVWNGGIALDTRYSFVDADPFQYPPPFLVLPRAVIALTDDFGSIYAVWFSLQATAFLFVAGWLAAWVGGRVGTVALLLLPVSLMSFPVLLSLQYGQFHLATTVLAIAAMLLFERSRSLAGGLLLGFAIVAKIFPGILLVWLLARRQWRSVAWTIAACVAFTLLGWAVVGADAYVAFVTYALPRLASGRAFDFGPAMPEIADLVVTSLQSPYGIVMKLEALGVPGMSRAVGAFLGQLLALILAFLAYYSARRRKQGRAEIAVAWLALLGLGSLVNAGAWGDYATLSAVWILTFCALAMAANRRLAILLGTVGIFQFFVLGTMPIGEWYSLPTMIGLSLSGAVMVQAFYLWSLVGIEEGELEVPPRSAG